MLKRVTSLATSGALGLAAAVALLPASAHAAPQTYTGHVQVIVGDDIIGCLGGQYAGSASGRTTDPAAAITVSILPGDQQNLANASSDGDTWALGVDDTNAGYKMSQTSMGYTFMSQVSPVPVGSPSVNGQQSAIWSIDPGTRELSAIYVWDDQTSQPVESWIQSSSSYSGLSPNVAAVTAVFGDVTPATFRLGDECSGPYVRSIAQAITFTSSAPSPAYPGQAYTVAATGGASGNAVTFSSATEDVCDIDGSTVTLVKPGTCTIEANQAGATGYSAAPTATQDIKVSATPSDVAISLDKETVFDGQTTTATADVSVTKGSLSAAGGTVQFAVDGTDTGSPVAIDADGHAKSPELEGTVGTHDVTATYVPTNTNYAGSTDTATLTVKAKDSQTITFTSSAPSPAHPGQTYAVTATGGASEKPVTFSSATEDVCEIDGTTVTLTKPGTCTIEADQVGATGFSAAPTATQDITVTAIPSEVALSLDLDTVFHGQVATATADVSVTTGSLNSAGGTVQFAVDGTDVGSPVAIDADGRAVSDELDGSVGSHDVTATYVPADSNYAGSKATTKLTVTAKAPQAITFTSSAPVPAYPGMTYTIAATGGASGKPVTLSSTTTDHCTIDGDTVTFGQAGTCTIEATQAGSAGFTAAPSVTQDITVSAIPSAVTVSLGLPSVVTGQRTTATADVTVVAGSVTAAGGAVQFAVDGTDVGSPVAIDADGRAVSAELGGPVGSRQVTATYVPADGTNYVGSSNAAALTVAAASTTTKVAVTASELTATVDPVAPGAGTPTGEVTFHVDGKKVGTATLSGGIAKLAHTVPTDTTHAVSAEYAGDAGFTASSTSTSRSNPGITAKVGSAQKSRNGWYRTPVTVSFTCDAKGADLVTPCPKPVKVSKQGASSVTRTIRTADGGIATATAAVKVDSGKPRVSIKGVKAGRSYFDAPKAACKATDSVSGVQTCKITSKRRGAKVVVTAKATDVAGNVSSKRVTYRVAKFTIRGAKKVGNTYRVKQGETYTLQVRGAKARYVYATPAPGKPHRGSVPFKKAGKKTWSLGVTMSMTTRGTRSWNLGYTQNGKLHVIKVKVTG